MLMFADKLGGWGWPNADVSKKKIKYPKKKTDVMFKVGIGNADVC